MKGILVYVFSAILSFGLISESLAQFNTEGSSCAMCKNGVHQNENPYKLGFRSEIPFIASSVAALGFGLLMQSVDNTKAFTEYELNQLDRNDVNAFDRPATYNWDIGAKNASDIFRNGVIILPIIFLSNHHTKSDFGQLLVMGLEVGAITYGLTLGIKHTFNRARPLAYNENAPIEERTKLNARLSFFSGHVSFTTAFSFYVAKVMSDYHPNMKTGYKIALWSFSGAIPLVTSYLRVKSGLHFTTDVIVGYALGAFVGWVIPELHKNKELSKKLSIAPQFIRGSKGLYISCRF